VVHIEDIDDKKSEFLITLIDMPTKQARCIGLHTPPGTKHTYRPLPHRCETHHVTSHSQPIFPVRAAYVSFRNSGGGGKQGWGWKRAIFYSFMRRLDISKRVQD